MQRIILVILIVTGCATPRAQRPGTPRLGFTAVADSLVLLSDLNQTHWGIHIFDPARNRTLYSWDGRRHYIPASNTKLVVTSVAMGLLGPDWRYQTEFVTTAAPGDSIAERLIAVGSGDPTWSRRFHPSDMFVLEQIADSIARTGLRTVRELVIDVSRFGRERVHSSWEVGDLPFSYAAPTSAFAIAEGTIRLIAQSGLQTGEIAKVEAAPPASVFPVRSIALTDTAGASSNINVDYQAWPDTILASGRVGLNRADTSTIAAPNAVIPAAHAFQSALSARGVTVDRLRIVYDSADAAALRRDVRVIATWQSAPLSAIIAAIHKPSQNWIAEQLLRTLGALQRGRGSWNAGIDVERRYLIDVARIDSTSFSLRDASGLSAQNLLSPDAIIQLLEYNRQQSWAQLFRQSLPSPMERGGTLSNRLAGLEGRVFAKTGTIANVNSLSGYITTRGGRELVFSIMTNSSGRPSAQVRRGIDRLVMALAAEADWE